MPDEAPLDWPEAQAEEDGFHLSNLFPRDTGLPMTVWVGERAGGRHDVRVKVSEMASVAVRPRPRLVHGDLTVRNLTKVTEWMMLNEAVIIDHWEGRASTIDLARRLQRLPG